MTSFLSKSFIGLFVGFLICQATQFGLAQDPLTDREKAVVCYELHVDSLLESELVAALGQNAVDLMMSNFTLETIDAKDLTRVFGLIAAPESLDAAIKNIEDENRAPSFDFVIRYELKTVEATSAMIEWLELDTENPVEWGGRSYYPNKNKPETAGVFGAMENDTTIIYGTRAFISEKFPSLFCEELQDVWAQQPKDSPLRVSIAGQTRADFIEQAVGRALEIGPEFASTIQLVNNVENLNLTLSPNAKEMFEVRIKGKDDAKAVELRDGLNGLLGIAKLSTGGMFQELKEYPALSKTMRAMLQDLRAVGEGTAVDIIVRKPESFAAALGELKEKQKADAMQAQMDAGSSQVNTLKNVCKMYKLNTGKFPANLNDLVVKPDSLEQQAWRGPYLRPNMVSFVDGNLLDPWNNPFRYSADEINLTLTIISNGPDGLPDTADDIGK